jgi:hypothetical protein
MNTLEELDGERKALIELQEYITARLNHNSKQQFLILSQMEAEHDRQSSET